MNKGLDSFTCKLLDREYHYGFNDGYLKAMEDYKITDMSKALEREIIILNTLRASKINKGKFKIIRKD